MERALGLERTLERADTGVSPGAGTDTGVSSGAGADSAARMRAVNSLFIFVPLFRLEVNGAAGGCDVAAAGGLELASDVGLEFGAAGKLE